MNTIANISEIFFAHTNFVIIGTIGKMLNNVDYSMPPDYVRRSEKMLLQNAINLPFERIVMLNQVHGDAIIEIHGYPSREMPWIAEADGLLTSLPDLCLVIRTADCVPVFAFDPHRKLLGAVHSGWRGCQQNITGKLLRLMKNNGSTPSDIKLFILPSIGPQSYTVNWDVAQFFPHQTIQKNGKIYLDLWKCIESSAIKEGILHKHIFNAQRCTFQNELYFSHRRGDTGRNLNFGVMGDKFNF